MTRRLRTRTTLALVLLALLPAAGRAQEADVSLRAGTGTILGAVVTGDSGAPLPGTGIEVWSVADSVRVANTVSGDQGRFRVGGLPEGVYRLRLTNLGYGTVTTEAFELAYDETRDLGTLRLPVDALVLEPIRVSTQREAVTYEADRTSYNVGAMPGTEGATVEDVLRAIPELEIDIDGNITIRGSTPTIYIDGRPAPMTAEALLLFLQQFPAEYLAHVEVMETPSARYSAEGSGGILNLVLKEGAELGMSGSVFARTGTRGQHSGGLQATWQKGEWTATGRGSFNYTDVESTSYDLRQNLLTQPAFLRQDAWSDRSGQGGDGTLQLRFEPNDRIRLSARGQVDGRGGESGGSTTTTHLDDLETEILRYERTSDSRNHQLSASVSAGFEYRWEPRRHELQIGFMANRGRDSQNQREEVTTDSLLAGPLIPAELTVDDRHGRDTGRRFDAEYTHPLGEDGLLETGYRLTVNDNDDDRVIELADDPATPSSTDRGYRYRRTVQAGYLTVGHQLGRVGLQAGLRAEQTDTRLEIPTGEAFDNNYLGWFPTANISYRPSRTLQLRVSYSRRTQLPSVSVLNPVDRSTDPLTRRIGNPDVEPQFTHSVSASINWRGSKGGLRLSPYYRRTLNGWAETISVDADGVSTRTYNNVASETSYGATLTYSLRPVEGWNGFLSVGASRVVRDASNLSDRYSGDSFRLSSRARIQARITDALFGEGSFSYSPPVDLPQGRSDARYAADFGLRYRFLDNRASLRLSLQDPFELRRSGVRTQDLSYIQIGRSRQTTRNANITFSYTIGGGGSFRGRGR